MAEKSTSGRKITGSSVRKRKRKFNLITIGTVLAAVLLFFFGFFYVSKVEVAGSTRYTDSQVRNMVMDSFFHHNSIILSLTRKNVVPDNAPFISNIEVSVEGHNKVRLVVDEKVAAGYIEQNGINYYFSEEGIVLDAIRGDGSSEESVLEGSDVNSSSAEMVKSSSATEQTSETAGSASSAEGTGTVSASSAEGSGTVSASSAEETGTASASETEGSGTASASSSAASGSQDAFVPLEAVPATTVSASDASGLEMETGEDSDYRPAVADVPRVTGLTDQNVEVGEKIKPICGEDEIFTRLQTITRLVNRFENMPDEIGVSEKGEITLAYNGGEIQVLLGKGDLLEDQMARVSAILPQLEGMSGTLHLENFAEDTVNIVFDPKK
ncbi:MAG: cell division protein FtsQ/DivIB [Eubacterium sp.]|nr:cell division protein FtsQ/DivIB [Eubacterium sp.]